MELQKSKTGFKETLSVDCVVIHEWMSKKRMHCIQTITLEVRVTTSIPVDNA